MGVNDNFDLLKRIAEHCYPVEEERRAALLAMAAPEQPAPASGIGESCHDLAISILQTRKAIGLARYGRPLQAGNGRDVFRDLMEELADAIAYCAQASAEMQRLREMVNAPK